MEGRRVVKAEAESVGTRAASRDATKPRLYRPGSSERLPVPDSSESSASTENVTALKRRSDPPPASSDGPSEPEIPQGAALARARVAFSKAAASANVFSASAASFASAALSLFATSIFSSFDARRRQRLRLDSGRRAPPARREVRGNQRA